MMINRKVWILFKMRGKIYMAKIYNQLWKEKKFYQTNNKIKTFYNNMKMVGKFIIFEAFNFE